MTVGPATALLLTIASNLICGRAGFLLVVPITATLKVVMQAVCEAMQSSTVHCGGLTEDAQRFLPDKKQKKPAAPKGGRR
jgi:hypothetical protein